MLTNFCLETLTGRDHLGILSLNINADFREVTCKNVERLKTFSALYSESTRKDWLLEAMCPSAPKEVYLYNIFTQNYMSLH